MSVMQNISVEPKSKRRKIDSDHITSTFSSSNCGHFFVRYGICCNCRSTVERHQGRAFDYLVDGLQLSHEAVKVTKLATTQIICFNDKKLHLVLDLDHTIMVSHLSEQERYLIGEADSREDLWKYNGGYSSEFLIKLRPFVHEFLKEANEMFVMYVYTMGDRDYANNVLKLIDPEKIYFGDRVITREESPFIKTLDLVLADECGVVIVDDSPHVWPHHKRNLLEITKYNYFKYETIQDVKQYSKSFAEEKRDESWKAGSLANILKLLKEVYEEFFGGRVDKELAFDLKDVRVLLRDPCRPKCSC